MTKFSEVAHMYTGCKVDTGGWINGNAERILAYSDVERSVCGIAFYFPTKSDCVKSQLLELPIKDIKPILRPLSSMTEEIEHNGTKFIPLKVLAGMAGTCGAEDWDIKSAFKVEHKTVKGCTFRVTHSANFIMKRSDKWKDFEVCAQQLRMFLKAIEWHFDLFNLIKSGSAIDASHLKINL